MSGPDVWQGGGLSPLGSYYNAGTLGFQAWSFDPAISANNNLSTSGSLYVAQVIPTSSFTLNNIGWIGTTGGSGLATVATATTQTSGGNQTAPASGSWTLTTSAMSGYPTSGVVTIGSQVLAYSAWSGTSMTVLANGYTPGATFPQSTTITANCNCWLLYSSTGAFIGSTVDRTTSGLFTGTGFKQDSLVPAMPFLRASQSYYLALLCCGTTPQKISVGQTQGPGINASGAGLLSGANLRYGVNGSSLTTGAPSSITPSSATAIGAVAFWWGLS